MTQKKGIVIDKTAGGIPRIRIHADTIKAYLDSIQLSKGGWVDHLMIPHDRIEEGRPTHKLILDTPQHPRETKVTQVMETKAA